MAFKPSMKRRHPPGEVALDMTPIMNLMVCLIPILLSAAKFTELALLEYLPPAETTAAAESGAPPEESAGSAEEAKLNLLVNLAETGVQVSMFQTVEPGPYFYEIPKSASGDYDFNTLHDSLIAVKENIVGQPIGKKTIFVELDSTYREVDAYKYADATEVSITALGSTTFQTVIRLMDVCQKYVREEVVNGNLTRVEKELFPNTILKQFQ